MEAEESLLITLAEFFHAHAIPYMITGAWSVIFYGRPRASHDIDFVVDLFPKDVQRTVQALASLPSEFTVYPESVREGIEQRNIFQIYHKPTIMKIDVWLLTNDPFDQVRFKRKKYVNIIGKNVSIASAEDTILQKLRWYKEAKIEKHIIDAAFVYQIQGKRLDKRYITAWAKKLGITRYINKLGSINLEQYL